MCTSDYSNTSNNEHSPSSGFPSCPHASATATLNWLFCTEISQVNVYSLILIITSWHETHIKHQLSLLYSLVPLEACLFVNPLLSNGCRIIISFVGVAQLRVYV
jgi:hypothetical protein